MNDNTCNHLIPLTASEVCFSNGMEVDIDKDETDDDDDRKVILIK